MIQQSLVCIIAIVICKQLGLITNLAPFDPKKAKTCGQDSILGNI
jgi:GDP-mannose transporter